ncbi:hypothetical protein MMC22_002475 [Lobaria immixta]|nr:hypothetical protein [Lobaria immixta]
MLPFALCFFSLSLASVFARGNRLQEPLLDSRNPFSPELDALIEETLDHFHVPGLSIAVIDGNETFAKGYGIAEFPTKATPETLYYTGSTTKSFTAAAISILLDDSVNSSSPLKWTTPISSLIRDDFVLTDEYATSHVTLEDALSHRTGMPRHDFTIMYNNVSVQDVVRNFRHLPMTAEIRTRFQYCNLMFITLGHMIETLSGMWLGHFLRTRIWEPLSMSGTYLSLADAKDAVKRGNGFLARGYFWEDTTQTYVPEDHFDSPSVSGAGGVISNVLDYSKYLRAMIDQAPPLSPAAHVALRTPRSIMIPIEEFPNAGPITYASGWIVSSYRGETLLSHDGAIFGFGALMLYMPWRKWGITMMANTVGSSNAAQKTILYSMLDKLLDTPPKDRMDWKGILDSQMEERRKSLNNSRERLYPDLPKNPIPLSLPLEQYTGFYSHAGYGVLNLTLADSEPQSASVSCSAILRTALVGGALPLTLDFEHVNGEYFLVSVALIKSDGFRDVQDVNKAEYRLNQAGKVEELGIILDAEMGEDKIWFKKVG